MAPLSFSDSRSLVLGTVPWLCSAPSRTQQHFRESLGAQAPVLTRETSSDLEKGPAFFSKVARPRTALGAAPRAVPRACAPVPGSWSEQRPAESRGGCRQRSDSCPPPSGRV